MSKAEIFGLAWGLFTLLATSLFKAPTPEEFEAAPRWSSVRKFCSSLGFDGPRALESIAGLIKGASGVKSATAEHVAALPKALRNSLPPLAEPKRIDSGLIEAVKPEGDK